MGNRVSLQVEVGEGAGMRHPNGATGRGQGSSPPLSQLKPQGEQADAQPLPWESQVATPRTLKVPEWPWAH